MTNDYVVDPVDQNCIRLWCAGVVKSPGKGAVGIMVEIPDLPGMVESMQVLAQDQTEPVFDAVYMALGAMLNRRLIIDRPVKICVNDPLVAEFLSKLRDPEERLLRKLDMLKPLLSYITEVEVFFVTTETSSRMEQCFREARQCLTRWDATLNYAKTE